MSARDDISTLMNRYCYSIDTGDFAGFAELFAHGEWAIEGGVSEKGKTDLLAGMANIRRYEDGTPRTRHTTSNVELIIDEDAGKATSRCYMTVYQQTTEFPLQVIFSGHYFDDFERVDDVWRFTRRLIRHQFIGDMSAHVRSPAKLTGQDVAAIRR